MAAVVVPGYALRCRDVVVESSHPSCLACNSDIVCSMLCSYLDVDSYCSTVRVIESERFVVFVCVIVWMWGVVWGAVLFLIKSALLSTYGMG